MECDDSIDAPQDAVTWVKNLARTRIPEARPSIIRKIAAALKADVLPGQAAFGERAAGISTARQMLFEADDHAVDLRIKSDGGAVSVHGQIFGTGYDDARVTLSNDSSSFEARVDADGEFRIGDIPSGIYTMILGLEAADVVIERLELG